MDKKIVKNVKKEKKIKQKQKQSQKQTVVVNVGTLPKSRTRKTTRPPKKQMMGNQISMFPAPSIYTYPPSFRETETAPRVSMPTSIPVSRPTPFAEQPIRRPREFFTETSTVEFLPTTTEGIVNEYTDDPIQINAGIIDDYNPITNTTDYIQTQPPSLSMTIYNPVEDNQIDTIDRTPRNPPQLKMTIDEPISSQIPNNYDTRNIISSKFIRPPQDDTIDGLTSYDALTMESFYDEEDTLPDYYNPKIMKKRAKKEDVVLNEVRTDYVPAEVSLTDYKKLPLKPSGDLALTHKNLTELRAIAEILGVDTYLTNGRPKPRSILTNDIEFDMKMRRKRP